MNNLRELLRDADPLRHEPARAAMERDFRRQAILSAARSARTPAGMQRRSRVVVIATAAMMLIAAFFLGALIWSLMNNNLHAAVRFEVRLAEVSPVAGLQKARVSRSDKFVYLHDEVLVSNSDIASAQVVRAAGQSPYAVSIKFTDTGARKMHAATENHIGKPVAILLDGQVVMAPVVRSPIGALAEITGHFTKAQAEKIARGIEIH